MHERLCSKRDYVTGRLHVILSFQPATSCIFIQVKANLRQNCKYISVQKIKRVNNEPIISFANYLQNSQQKWKCAVAIMYET